MNALNSMLSKISLSKLAAYYLIISICYNSVVKGFTPFDVVMFVFANLVLIYYRYEKTRHVAPDWRPDIADLRDRMGKLEMALGVNRERNR